MAGKNKGLTIGSKIPQFSLQDTQNNTWTDKDLMEKNNLVFIMRGTWWPNSRGQLGQLQDVVSKFQEHNIQLITIFPQKGAKVKQYSEKHKFDFPLLIDEERKLTKDFEVYRPIGYDGVNTAHPSMFLVDKDNSVTYSYISKNQLDLPKDEEIFKLIKKYFNINLPSWLWCFLHFCTT